MRGQQSFVRLTNLVCADRVDDRATGTGGDDLLVAGVLQAQLHDVDTSPERGLQEIVGSVITDEVEMGIVQLPAAVAHAPSLAGAPR